MPRDVWLKRTADMLWWSCCVLRLRAPPGSDGPTRVDAVVQVPQTVKAASTDGWGTAGTVRASAGAPSIAATSSTNSNTNSNGGWGNAGVKSASPGNGAPSATPTTDTSGGGGASSQPAPHSGGTASDTWGGQGLTGTVAGAGASSAANGGLRGATDTWGSGETNQKAPELSGSLVPGGVEPYSAPLKPWDATPESLAFARRLTQRYSWLQGDLPEGSIRKFVRDGGRFPIMLLTCNRPKMLRSTLDSLLQVRGVHKDMVYAVQDGQFPAVQQVIDDAGLKLKQSDGALCVCGSVCTGVWERCVTRAVAAGATRLRKGRPVAGVGSQPWDIAAANIARHYLFSLSYIFDEAVDAPGVIVVEDDFYFSPDFLEYFTATAPLLVR